MDEVMVMCKEGEPARSDCPCLGLDMSSRRPPHSDVGDRGAAVVLLPATAAQRAHAEAAPTGQAGNVKIEPLNKPRMERMRGEVDVIASIANQEQYWTECDGIAAFRRSFIGALVNIDNAG